jgi:DNA processing protein
VLGVGRDGARGEWRAGSGEPGSGTGTVDANGASPVTWPTSTAPSTALARRSVPTSGSLSVDEVDAWAVLVAVDGIGPVTLAALLAALGSGRAVLATAAGPAGPRRLAEAVAGRGGHLDATLGRAIADAAIQAPVLIARVRALGIEVLTIESPDYPGRLRLLDLPPPVLFVRGAVAALDPARSVAIVGTRRATERGRRIAGAIGGAVSTAGAVVVSGLAIGIDGAAHAAAVACGGRTVAVLGSGHQRLYPRAHGHLADEIVAGGGAVISELAPDVGPVPGTFPRRNRVISGLADATVIVEARERSGALITASWTLEQGRECFVVPGPLDAEQSLGCNRLLRLFPGQARAVASVAELLEDLGLAGTTDRLATDRRSLRGGRAVGPDPEAILAGLGAAEVAVARALLPRAATLEELLDATGFAPATILAVLTRLEGQGLVVAALGRYGTSGALAATTPQRRRERPRGGAMAAPGGS